MKALILAASFLMWSFQAHADPLLTPLVASAFAEAGLASTLTITGFNVAVAVTSYALTAGAISNPTALKVKP